MMGQKEGYKNIFKIYLFSPLICVDIKDMSIREINY